MTRKELKQVKKRYQEIAKECILSNEPYARITGICGAIALEECYTHHERGQRIWAFFTAIKELGKEG